MERSGIVTLTTDFGLADAYVGAMKGVILSLAPGSRLVDITHEVRPQAILQGAFLLAGAWRFFPRGTVHLAVVDPGVGTERAAIAMETPEALFVAPDNGLLTWVWEDLDESARRATRIVTLSEARFWRSPVSPTFHGRDIFAPVAAHLAAGTPLKEVGPRREGLVLLTGIRPTRLPDGSLLGTIVHIDRFGNCVSNIAAGAVKAAAGPPRIEIAGQILEGLVQTYAEGPAGRPCALIGSAGFLEVAVPAGHAARLLGVQIGDALRLGGEPCPPAPPRRRPA